MSEFIKCAWHVIEPSTEYKHGKHIDAICQHLEAVTSCEITRLLINIPPGTMKSLLMNVFWPAWEWGPKGMPGTRYVGASHEQGLSVRDNRKMRILVESEWYQERWPLDLAFDQNAKIKFENQSMGFRQACAVASMTGNRGDRVLWDDPNKADDAFSPVELKKTIRLFQETLPTRMNDPEKSAIVICMQRIHEEDISGFILEQGLPYVHLMLPMEYEPERHCSTAIGFEDWRTEEGELLFPERFPRHVVERDKQAMGSMAVAGQFQQSPSPRSGGFFEWENLEVVGGVPADIDKMVRYWDKAGTAGGGAYTAGVLIGHSPSTMQWYIMDVVRGQWAASKRENVILQTANADHALYGRKVTIWIEQEPGSGGKESAEATVKNLAGFVCKAETATGDKALRAEPYSVQVEASNIKVRSGAWNDAFINEHKTFPMGKYKDQIDAAGGAFNKLTLVKTREVRVMVI